MNQTYILIGFALIFLIVILITKFFNKGARIKRKLKKAVYCPLDKFKDNEIAKITGEIELIENPLISPLSQRKCAFYYINVEQKVSSGKNSRWETIIEEEVSSRYLIKNGEHYAFINDKDVKFYVVKDKNYSSGFLNDPTNLLENYLLNKGIKITNFLGLNKTIEYKEGVFEVGEEISVLGKGIWKDAANLNLPKKYGKILEITSTKDMHVYVSDDPSTTLKLAKKKNNLIKYNNRENRYQK